MLGVNGWPFSSVDPFPGAEIDPLYNSEHVKDLYLRADPNYSARYVSFYYLRHTINPWLYSICLHRPSVPVLWDKKNHTVVNNDSAEIIRIFNTAFNDLLPDDNAKVDLYPANIQSEINEVNKLVFSNINSTYFCVVLVDISFFW